MVNFKRGVHGKYAHSVSDKAVQKIIWRHHVTLHSEEVRNTVRLSLARCVDQSDQAPRNF